MFAPVREERRPVFNAELIEKVARFRGVDEDPSRNLSACPALVLNAD